MKMESIGLHRSDGLGGGKKKILIHVPYFNLFDLVPCKIRINDVLIRSQITMW